MIVGRWRATRGLPLFGRLRLHGGTIPTALLVLAMATAAGALRAQDLDPQRIVDPLERLDRQAAWLSDASDGFDEDEDEDESEEDFEEPEPVYTPEEDARNAAERVLSSEPFRHLRRPEAPKLPELEEGSWISRFLRWLFGDGESRSSERATTTSSFAWGFILRLIAALLIIATLLVITLGIVRARPGEKEAKSVDPAAPEEDPELSGPPGERPPDWWLGQAAREADHGMYRRAIGLVLLASRSSLERDGKIHYRQGLTNRDYLRAARGDPRVARALSSITVHSELVIYGRRSATRERYSECVRLFEEGFLHAPERV